MTVMRALSSKAARDSGLRTAASSKYSTTFMVAGNLARFGAAWRFILFKGATRRWILAERDLPGFYLQAKLSDANTERENAAMPVRLFMEQFEGFEEYGDGA